MEHFKHCTLIRVRIYLRYDNHLLIKVLGGVAISWSAFLIIFYVISFDILTACETETSKLNSRQTYSVRLWPHLQAVIFVCGQMKIIKNVLPGQESTLSYVSGQGAARYLQLNGAASPKGRETLLVGNLNIPMLNGLFSCVPRCSARPPQEPLVLYPWICFGLSSGPMPLAKGLVGVWYSWALA